jgi:hypothetical protein
MHITFVSYGTDAENAFLKSQVEALHQTGKIEGSQLREIRLFDLCFAEKDFKEVALLMTKFHIPSYFENWINVKLLQNMLKMIAPDYKSVEIIQNREYSFTGKEPRIFILAERKDKFRADGREEL